MPITIYGIKNCDPMKKARAWLDKQGGAYDFHDFKTASIDRERFTGVNRVVYDVTSKPPGTIEWE